MKAIGDVLAEQDAAFKRTLNLYHGSMYKQDELMPGFKRSGELTNWDRYESNMFLYASSHKNSAVLLGIASAMEKKHDLASVMIDHANRTIKARFRKNAPNKENIFDLEVYLYTLAYREEDGWVKNKNPFNNIETEWKTKNTITSNAIISRETVNVPQVLKDFHLDLALA